MPRTLRKRRKLILENLGEVTELAESTGLENRRRATYRGFESHPLRHIAKRLSIHWMAFFLSYY